MWGFRDRAPLPDLFSALSHGLRPRLGFCRHFGVRLLHKPNCGGSSVIPRHIVLCALGLLFESITCNNNNNNNNSYRDGSCSGEKWPESELRDCNAPNFLTFGEGTSSKTTRQVIIIKIDYVLQIHRSQIKNIQLSTILILEFAQRFNGTTPPNHPSALRPSINRPPSAAWPQSSLSLKKENNEIREKIIKIELLFKPVHQIACRVSSLNFHKFSGEWLVELLPQISFPLYLGSGFVLNYQALRAIGSGFVSNFPLRNFDLVASLKLAYGIWDFKLIRW